MKPLQRQFCARPAPGLVVLALALLTGCRTAPDLFLVQELDTVIQDLGKQGRIPGPRSPAQIEKNVAQVESARKLLREIVK